MARIHALLLTLLAALALPASGTPSISEAGLPFVRTFTPRNYAAGPQNWATVQDARGVIYVGNNDGVLEFDGVRWRLIPVANKTDVLSLDIDPSGRIYVGAKGEVGTLEPDGTGAMRYVSLMERLPPEERGLGDVWQTLATSEGVYFSSFTRLIRLSGGKVQTWKPETRFQWSFLAGGRVFIRDAGRGLLELVKEELRLVPGGERFKDEKLAAVIPWEGDAFLIGTRSQGLFLLGPSGVRPFRTEADALLKRDLLYKALRLADGAIALGTLQGGLIVMDAGGRVRGRLSKSSGLGDDTVLDLAQDRQGGLWVGLNMGLARVQVAFPITVFGDTLGLQGSVYALHRHKGTFYAATSMGVFRLVTGAEGTFRFIPIPQIQGQTWAFLDWGYRLLVANQKGVYELHGHQARLVRPSGQQSGFLLRSTLDPSRVFVGLQDGLASMRDQGGVWVDEGKIPHITENVRTLVEAPDHSLWIGTWAEGFLRVRLQGTTPQVERFGLAEGLPDIREAQVFPLDGSPLFATHQGFYRFNEATGRFVPDERFQTLFPGGTRWAMGIRWDGVRLWMHAVEESTRQSEQGFASRSGQNWQWQPAPPMPLASQPDSGLSTWVDSDGVVWFGCPSDGIFRYDPRVPKDYAQSFHALVRKVTRGEEVLSGQAPELRFLRKTMRFEFSAPTLDVPDATRFQVWLEGTDSEWSPWTLEAYRDYSNLREGDYRFRVRAKNSYGTVSQEAIYPFRILPPWWRTWWAWVGYVAGGASAVTGLLRWNARRLRRKNLDLERLVAERTDEVSRMNTALLLANEEVEQASQYKSTFLASMSHELRTPLNAILLYAELLWEEAEDAKDQDRAGSLDRIRSSGQHLLKLINGILDLSKIEAGKMTLFLEDIALGGLLADVAGTLQPMVEAKGNRIEVRIEPGLETLHTDLTKLRQILYNLISNACKFTEKGIIHVEAERIGDAAAFHVRDTGVGMTHEQLSRLFQAFVQAETSTSKHYGGTGLGLTISRRICELMGGTITVESETGVGTTFTVMLPLVVWETAVARESGTLPSDPEGRKTIALVIDDDRVLRDYLTRTLGKEGFWVATASNGAEGLHLARKLHPQVIILDVVMEGMDGWTVLTELKQDPDLKNIPVVLLSMLDDQTKGFALGASMYLQKPVMGEDLAPILRRLQGDRKVRALVVEDDEMTRSALATLLARQGWDATAVADTAEALESLRSVKPDCILLDLFLPGMDGFTLAERLRENSEWRDIPVMVLTSKDVSPEEQARLQAAQAGRILRKGAHSKQELADIIQSMVHEGFNSRPGR
ncbi:MAG: response regulator [Acidobacteria bacterium]|nr:response regulator [Acidobacteriota bacterium]